ncbi:MAG: glycosyltransferase [Gammaproteobacteria bacterium]|nr:glycosyltransferase [Gammaproteobacteria bacterium]
MAKILHLIPTMSYGGAERQLSMLATEQVGRGWEVHVGIRRGGAYKDSLQNSDVIVHSLGDYRGLNPLLLIRISRLIRDIEPDIVQTWLPQMDIIGGIASLFNSAPWVITERTGGLAYQSYKIQNTVRCFLARYANSAVANSAHGAAFLRRILPTASHVYQVANAVDITAIRRAVSGCCEMPNQSDSMKNIFVVGRLAPEKSLDVIIRAVTILTVKTNIHVYIMGEGPLRNEIERWIRSSNLVSTISLLSSRQDWWGLLRNASALISMSRFEGHPNVVLETMAAGCPLIVSDIPAHREFLDEDTAILVPPDNPVMLAQAICSLVLDPLSAQQRAECAAERVGRLTIGLAADAYESIYEMVLERKKQSCVEL